ncbi:MAG: bifunctional homocysteine S-methyltransferase/methylenetetrahydrofolate reductase [Sedimentisphaeraceae bacterium JB056]
MSKLKNLLANGVVIGDGAIGTLLYQRGVFVNRCFEELNITGRQQIKDLHCDYVNAGSDFIETNTYGANKIKLAAFGLSDKVRELNIAGVDIAREAAGEDVLVAGSVGPVVSGFRTIDAQQAEELEDVYKEQVSALVEGGVDFIILETFSNSDDLLIAVEAAAEVCELEIVASLRPEPDQTEADTDKLCRDFARIAANDNVAVMGLNCGAGPAIMLRYLEAVRNISEKPLCIQANVGMPQMVDGRMIYMATPEYVAEYAKRFYEKGADIIGGCCGTGPEHIKEICKAVKSVSRADREAGRVASELTVVDAELPEPATAFANRSRFAEKIASGKKVRLIEVTPPRSISLESIIEKVQLCSEKGIDAINIPDGPRASCRQSALSAAINISRQVDTEVILHVCSRDRNIIALQSDMLGAQSLGVNNMLFITGDPPKLGDYPDATGVFDVDAVGLVRMGDMLNRGFDVSGRAIPQATSLTIGVGVNPGANDMKRELDRFEMKVRAGAEYCITQPAFDTDVFKRFVDSIDDFRIPVIAGIWPFVSYKNAEFMANEVPGVVVPQNLLERMSKTNNKEDAIKVGVDIVRESMEATEDLVAGFAVCAPFGNVKIALAAYGLIDADEI